jgi:hypothetical protein
MEQIVVTDNKKIEESTIKSALTPLGPDQPRYLSDPSMAVVNRTNDEIVTLINQEIMVFAPGADQYRLDRQARIPAASDSKQMSAVMAAGREYILVAFGNAQVSLVDSMSLEVIANFRPESGDPPTQVVFDESTGHFMVLYRNGRLWELDPSDAKEMRLANVGHQGSISGFTIGPDGRHSICHSLDQVSFSKPSAQPTFVPKSTFITNLFRYVVNPIYLICPKPSEFYHLVTHLATNNNTSEADSVDFRDSDPVRNPWSPLWSGLRFMACMLFISCVYFSRTDC